MYMAIHSLFCLYMKVEATTAHKTTASKRSTIAAMTRGMTEMPAVEILKEIISNHYSNYL